MEHQSSIMRGLWFTLMGILHGCLAGSTTAESCSACEVDSTHFPFDSADCSFQFGSWTQSAEQVTLKLDSNNGFGLESYWKSTLWDLTHNSASQKNEIYNCCPEPYTVLTYKIKLQRRAGFQLKIIIIPAASLPLMAGCMFWIPPERPDRVGIGVSFFSAFFLLLLLLSDYTPPEASSDFATFCGLNMILIAVAILVSVCSVNISRQQRPVPWYLKTVCIEGFGRCMCLASKQNKPDNTGPEANGSSTNDSKPSAVQQWRLLTLILDRLLFIFYMLGVTVVFLLVFPRPVDTS